MFFFSVPNLHVITPEHKIFLEKTGNLLRDLRIEKKFSQKQLAFEIGISRAQYQFIEKGQANFSVLTLLRIAEALEVDPRMFLNLGNEN